MRISDHYEPFEKKTLIAVTNNELARLLTAEDREVDELETITTSDIEVSDRPAAAPNAGPADVDAMKNHRLSELYAALIERLNDLTTHGGYEQVLVCVPEVNKNQFADHVSKPLSKSIKEIVPKNLASMDIPHIIRILLEG